jgi:NAD+ kinase
MSNKPVVLILLHNDSVEANKIAAKVSQQLGEAKVSICALKSDKKLIQSAGFDISEFVPGTSVNPNLALVFGGDGTILRAVEVTRDSNIPVLGINLGHVGFLAEAEVDHIEDVVKAIVEHDWIEEKRLAIDVVVTKDNEIVFESFALNDVAIEKAEPGHMFDLILEIDSKPVSRLWGDGIVLATPTGSTAYAFSAGGPVIWPSVEALLVVPISAHALFAKPLVVDTKSLIAIEVPQDGSNGHLTADGRRSFDLSPGMRIEVRKSASYVNLARLDEESFSERLVKKFQLPVEGWRGNNKRK